MDENTLWAEQAVKKMLQRVNRAITWGEWL